MWLTFLALATAPAPDYQQSVKPILANRCRACHGALQQKGGLRTDTVAFLKEGGNGGAAIVAGNSAESSLIQRILGQDGKKKMPPEHEGETVPPADLAILRAWIDGGAKGPADEKPEADPAAHWAFQPPKKIKLADATSNPIDAILQAERARLGLSPADRAADSLLIRRLHLSLTGLPPALDEWGQPADPASLAKKAEALLRSDAHAERWARHFMDIWRYSDWWGLGAEVRNSHKHIWHWRDWILDSIKADKGYDAMLKEMLAADELYPTDPEKLRATGLLVRPYFLFNRNSWMEDTIEHLGKGLVGLTLNCARCHDHKYDPISQADYYRFRAILEPYQVRKDQVAGVLDLEKDAIPRIYDCNLDAKTYRYVRGDEKNPDLSRVLEPGVPKILGKIAFQPKAVTLPALASVPGLAPHIAKAHLESLQSEKAQAEKALESLRKDLAKAKTAPKTDPGPGKLIVKGFADAAKWKITGGHWKLTAEAATQDDAKAMRTELDFQSPVPTDFEVKARIKITGGDPYRSVGFAFDAEPGRENLVYASAYAADPKLQVAITENGNANYPDGGKAAKPIAIGKEFDLRLRVQGKTIHLEMDGKHALSFTLPRERKTGIWRIITYTATTEIKNFELSELPAGTRLNPKAPTDPERLAMQIQAKEAKLKALDLEAQAIPLVVKAMQADAAEGTDKKSARKAAAMAQAAAHLATETAELAKLKAEAAAKDKLDAQTKKVAEARKKSETPQETYQPLRGSFKSKESNQETQESQDKAFPKTSTGRRSALATWLTDRAHPLTARVIVNHVWTRHMGQPLVPTMFDFGRKGTPPAQQALLDWLAVDFMEHGYSLKHLHRTIVTSQTFALLTNPDPAHPGWKIDPANKTFWRRMPGRLESEAVRDCLLALGGMLDAKVGGPPVAASETSSRRRSLYFFHSHNEDQNFLAQFDSPNVLDCYRREESIVPQQALTLVNSKVSRESAAAIASRLDAGKPAASDDEYVKRAFRALLGQDPDPIEVRECASALKSWNQIDPKRGRTNLVHALLNHNDFITIR